VTVIESFLLLNFVLMGVNPFVMRFFLYTVPGGCNRRIPLPN